MSKSDKAFRVVARNSSDKTIEVESDQLLVATGRTPNSDTLDLGKAGVKTDGRGFVIVDKYLETNVKGYFALGDAAGHYLFKHTANHGSAIRISQPRTWKKTPVDNTAMPHAIFGSPQIAGAGTRNRI